MGKHMHIPGLGRLKGKRRRRVNDVENGRGPSLESAPSPPLSEPLGELDEEEALLYILRDPRSERSGYVGSLTDSQRAAMLQLRDMVESSGADLGLVRGLSHPEPLVRCLLRFLRANNFDPSKALGQLLEGVKWRHEEKMAELLQQSPREVLQADPPSVDKFLPRWHVGYDFLGRPVLVKQYGPMVVSELKKLTTETRLINNHMWEQEKMMELMRRRSEETGHIVDTVVIVLDVGGMRLSQVTKDFIAIMKAIANIDQRYFPEMLGQMFIVNTPRLFSVAWSIFSPLLDSRTTEKIKIHSRVKDAQPALHTAMDPAILPPEYTGTGAELSSRPSLSSTLAGEAEVDDAWREAESSAGSGGQVPLPRDVPRSDTTPPPPPALPSYAHQLAATMSATMDYASSWIFGAPRDPSEEESPFSDSDSSDDENFYDTVAEAEGERLNGTNGRPLSTNRLSWQWRPRSTLGRAASSSVTLAMAEPRRYPLSGVALYGERLLSRLLWLADVIDSVWMPLVVPMLQNSLPFLMNCLRWANAVTVVLCIVVLGFASHSVADIYWVSDLVLWIMWSSVVVIVMACLLLLLTMAGMLAASRHDHAALTFHKRSMGFLALLILLVGAFALALTGKNEGLSDLTWSAIERTLPSSLEGLTKEEFLDETVTTLKPMGASAVCLSIYLVLPYMLSTATAKKMQLLSGERERSMRTDPALREKQLRRNLLDSLVIVTSVAVITAAHACYGLLDALDLDLPFLGTATYMELAVALIVCICAAVGAWASASCNPGTLKLYRSLILPTEVFLISWASFMLSQMSVSDRLVEDAWGIAQQNGSSSSSSSRNDSLLEAQARAATTLLVGGVLLLSMSFVVLLSTLAAAALRFHVLQYGVMKLGGFRMDKHFENVHHTRCDWLLITWALVSGLWFIFVEGTYMAFHTWVADSTDVWLVRFWRALGKLDDRFLESYSYFIASAGISFFLLGPSCLMYAWSLYTKRLERHVVGVVLSSFLLSVAVLYMVDSAILGFKNAPPVDSALFWCGYMLVYVIRLLVTLLIFIYSLKGLRRQGHAAKRRTSRPSQSAAPLPMHMESILVRRHHQSSENEPSVAYTMQHHLSEPESQLTTYSPMGESEEGRRQSQDPRELALVVV
jgi:hypothetical protein